MLNAVDIRTPDVFTAFDTLIVRIDDPGVGNFLEFSTEVVRDLSALEFVNPNDDLIRGVFGYVSFGVPGIGAPVGEQPTVSFRHIAFLNYRQTFVVVPKDGLYDYARIWMRKGVKASWYAWYKKGRGDTGVKLLTPLP